MKITVPYSAYLAALMVAGYAGNLMVGGALNHWGIGPREWSGAVGILFAPFLHGSLYHLIGNLLPFVVLGGFIQLQGRSLFWDVTVLVTLIGGAVTWLFGAGGIHIGASGLVLGYLCFLFGYGYWSKRWSAMLIAGITGLVYGGLIFSLLDFRSHISIMGHLGGAGAGLLVAWLSAAKASSNDR